MRFLVFGALVTACGHVSPREAIIDAGIDPVDAPPGDIWPSGAEGISCRGLPAICGSQHDKSCCASSVVLGGTFYRDFDGAADVHSGTSDKPATVSTFRFDLYEVTVGRFRAFLDAGMGTRLAPPAAGSGAHLRLAGSGWDPGWDVSLAASRAALVAGLTCHPGAWTETAGSAETLPMNCITWFEAMAFCIWDGGYLPTEAEWNLAAAGGAGQRAYPWSSPPSSIAIDGRDANYFTMGVSEALVTVGTKVAGAGRWGQMDLAGNVAEWVLDRLNNYIVPCTNCASLVGFSDLPTHRMYRGGELDSDEPGVRNTFRASIDDGTRREILGARCARSP